MAQPLTDLVRQCRALVIAQNIQLHRLLISQLLEECQHCGGIAGLPAVDLLQHVSIFLAHFFVEAGWSNEGQTETAPPSLQQIMEPPPHWHAPKKVRPPLIYSS